MISTITGDTERGVLMSLFELMLVRLSATLIDDSIDPAWVKLIVPLWEKSAWYGLPTKEYSQV